MIKIITSFLREFSFGLWIIITSVVMWIPFHFIRYIYLRIFLKNLGKNSTILRNVKIIKPKNISIGHNSIVNNNVLLDGRGGELIIGNNVDIAQEVNIWTLEHDVNDEHHSTIGGKVIIEDYVWVATRVTILPNVTIGRGSVIASGAVVTKDVQKLTIVGGVPAKVIGIRDNKLNYSLYYRPWFV